VSTTADDASPYRALPATCARCAVATKPDDLRNGMCASCDAIRSIRIASTLVDRFGEILGVQRYRSRDDLELALGEAEQLYPEIWANIDHARAALARQGIATAPDPASAAERGFAVNRVDVDDGALGSAMRGVSSAKTAYLNADGHARARASLGALRAALPDVDWAALDRAEAKEIASVGSLGPSRSRRVAFAVIWLALAAVLVVAVIMLKAL